MRYLRAFISGVFLPSLILPFLMLLYWSLGKANVLNVKFLHFIPILWGIWNVLYVGLFQYILRGHESAKMFVSGAVLGLIVALIAVYGLKLPSVIGLPKYLAYLPLIIAPIAYGILWWLIVLPLNHIVGIKH